MKHQIPPGPGRRISPLHRIENPAAISKWIHNNKSFYQPAPAYWSGRIKDHDEHRSRRKRDPCAGSRDLKRNLTSSCRNARLPGSWHCLSGRSIHFLMKNLTSTPFTTSRQRINERHRRSRPLSLVRISPQPDFRPAVVLPDNGPEVVVAFISSHRPENLSPAGIALARSTPEFLTTGLKTDSVIRLY